MAGEGLPVQMATGVLGVAESGYYEALTRASSARSIRHAWLTDHILEVHQASNGTYGARRVHAELTLGRGIAMGHNAVEMPPRCPGCDRPGRAGRAHART